ncbi:uncharacterized protein LOC105801126 [Gossypium raimondii]|uniref:uncharacterized protein LOC105801126 n=1 Tax=Gossypium raimondii TaxID=29730 RepID=UPI00063AD17B|nr:uncharacterized protein LOC105801126 [Gossypium raimondii]
MHAAHLRLGKLWQYDRDVVHHGKLNHYSLVFKGKKFTLAPLDPKDVHNDQLKMKKFCDGVIGKKDIIEKAERKEAISDKGQNTNDPIDYKDVFNKAPKDLPPLQGIEHQIDLGPSATIPNCLAYQSNPEETKELQRQVDELLQKGYIRESLSPCVVPVL